MGSTSCAGIVLSGGKNSRMKGDNKAFLRIGSVSSLDRILEVLRCSFEEVLLVTKEPDLYRPERVKVVGDILNVQSPLSGIHAGLSQMRSEFAFVAACDAPFLKKEVVEMLVDEISSGADVIVPFSQTYFQPLCAVYSKRCLQPIEEQLLRNDLKVDRLFGRISLKKIPYERLMSVDPDLVSFFNVNTSEDLKTARKKLNVEHRTPACHSHRSLQD